MKPRTLLEKMRNNRAKAARVAAARVAVDERKRQVNALAWQRGMKIPYPSHWGGS